MLRSDRKLVQTPDQSNRQTNTQTSDIIIQNLKKKLTVCTLLSSELAAKHTPCETTASSLVVVRLRER